MRILWLCALPIHVLASGQQPFQSTSDQLLSPEIDQFIDDKLKEWNSPGGIGVAVVKLQSDGKWQVETKGYGPARADGTEITEEALFSIGSNSKLFDVFAAGLLISNESLSPRIDWDTPIASMLPEWDLMDPVATSASTILDLMSHRTGLPAHDLMYNRNDTDINLWRYKHLRPSLGFRDRFQYNNNMYTVLSSLPTRLLPHHPSYASYVKENIFDPLGLMDTTYSYDVAARTGHLAQGVSRTGRKNALDPGTSKWMPFWFTKGGEDGTNVLSGAGGVIMSLKDASVWLRALLLLGKNPMTGKSVIPPEVVDKAATGISILSGRSIHPSISPIVYGGGQATYSYHGHPVIEHGGSVPGIKSTLLRLPFDGIGLAVFSNDEVHGISLGEIIKYRLVDSILGLPAIDWNGLVKTGQEVLFNLTRDLALPRPENATMPLPLAQLEGLYTNAAYGNLTMCSIPSTSTPIDACRTLIEEARTTLPNVHSSSRPTLVAQWDKIWSTHLELGHFNGLLWNATAVFKYDAEACGEAWVDNHAVFEAEFAPDGSGFGFFGISGALPVPSKGSTTIQERAEVWFEKV